MSNERFVNVNICSTYTFIYESSRVAFMYMYARNAWHLKLHVHDIKFFLHQLIIPVSHSAALSFLLHEAQRT